MTTVWFEWDCWTTLEKKFDNLQEFNHYVDNDLDKNYGQWNYKYWSNNPEWVF